MSEEKVVSDRQLKFSYWFLSNKNRLKRLLLVTLIVINAGLYTRVLLFVIPYISDMEYMNKWPNTMIASTIDWPAIHINIAPKEAIVVETEIIKAGPGAYDVVIWLRNPNKKWYANNIDYKVIFAGQKTEARSTYLLPGEKMIVYAQDFRSTSNDAMNEDVHFLISDTRWEQISNVADYDLPNFITADTKIQSIDDQATQARVISDITNKSTANLRSVEVIALVWSNDELIAVKSTTLNDFYVNSTRPVDIRFSENILKATEVELYVQSDNLSKSNVIAN
ncbi:hypothetical protein KKG41_00865 [Patescibacteria group bacterium]|nr:hypothetical protein [Patescibacteria group bacterium]MBU1891024.1 hypothetical protein [Patescibacteria group bacterium]